MKTTGLQNQPVGNPAWKSEHKRRANKETPSREMLLDPARTLGGGAEAERGKERPTQKKRSPTLMKYGVRITQIFRNGGNYSRGRD